MQKTVTLKTPIIRGDKAFTEIEIIKPNVNALKGIKLVPLFELDVDTLSILLPRVTNPQITKADIGKMSLMDFTTLATGVMETMNDDLDSAAESGKDSESA